MSVYSDIQEIKTILEIDPDNHAEDLKLSFFNQFAGTIIEELLDRQLFRRSRTEYYGGSGTQKLLLRARPVLTSPTIQVFVDEGGFWGAASGAFGTNSELTYGADFSLWIDQDNGTSRCGILLRNRALWPIRSVRQQGFLSPFVTEGFGNIKVVYTGGYTLDGLPHDIRWAADLLITRMRHLMPLGLELNSENYEDRSISWGAERKHYLMALVRPHLLRYRNWSFG